MRPHFLLTRAGWDAWCPSGAAGPDNKTATGALRGQATGWVPGSVDLSGVIALGPAPYHQVREMKFWFRPESHHLRHQSG